MTSIFTNKSPAPDSDATPDEQNKQERTADARVPLPEGATNDMAHRADEGFFGPGSIAWKVWSYPTSALQGFFRSVTIEHLDPDLVAAVDDSGQVYKRTPTRYDRTMEYFAAVLFADAQTVTRMSDILMKVHDRSYGKNPVTGNDYEANKPSSQLWILVTAWHSILYTYEKFGPGKLSRDEENEYWEQMRIAASFQPIDLDELPRTRGQVQAYLDSWREKISASEAAVRNVDHILDGAETAFVELPKPIRFIIRPFFRRSIIATYPHWMRPMLGLKQSAVTDQAMFALWKPFLYGFQKSPAMICWVIKRICPRALRYIKPIYYKVPADSPKVYTPEVARRMFGNPLTPMEQREELLRKRREGAGQEAYGHNHVDGILEFSDADDEEKAKQTLASTEKQTDTDAKAG
ncbi:MAG: oxygenase MpaB family protein [Mycobacteriaceae bacterium]